MKRAEYVGVVVARGIGLLLILLAVTGGVSAFAMLLPPTATSGWTSYSPLATTSTTTSTTTFISTEVSWQTLLNPLAELLAGSGMILFSRIVGRWLALGLKEEETESGE